MTRRRPHFSLEQMELPLRASSPTPDELRMRRVALLKERRDNEQRRLLRDSRVEFEQLPN